MSTHENNVADKSVRATHATYLRWFARCSEYCSPQKRGLQSSKELRRTRFMQDYTETLRVGSKAPDFNLSAANREGEFTLSALLGSGILILEFLRGTW